MKKVSGKAICFKRLLPFVFFLLLFIPVASAQALVSSCDARFNLLVQYDSSKKYYPEKVWQKAANPELIGWNSQKLAAARKYSESIGSAAVLVIDNGVVVDCWGRISFPFKCHSIRKSLLNSLYGIHVDNGNIDLNKTLSELGIDDVNPPLTPMERSARVSDLLKSRSGIYHLAAYETKSMEEKRPTRGSHTPGTFWYYNNWDFNALLTIFEQQTGRKVFQEFEQRIAIPLQFEHFNLKKHTSYYYERDKSLHPAYLFRLSALDMARFGLLYLRSGRWKDQTILSERWIDESVQPHSFFGKNKFITGFGHLWWISSDHFQASGKGGHRMVIMPEKKIILVHRADTEKSYYPKVNLKRFTKLYDLIMEAKEEKK